MDNRDKVDNEDKVDKVDKVVKQESWGLFTRLSPKYKNEDKLQFELSKTRKHGQGAMRAVQHGGRSSPMGLGFDWGVLATQGWWPEKRLVLKASDQMRPAF